jgi:hypothetical protein
MAKAGYTVATGAAVALSAATAKTVLAVIAPAQFGVDLRGFELSLDGATSTAVPALWELCASTFATNSTPGTGNTTATVNQEYGRSITAGFTGFYASTSEPTVLTPLYADYIPVFNGLVIRDFPFNGGPDSPVSNGFVLRVTAPAAVNARATFRFERC